MKAEENSDPNESSASRLRWPVFALIVGIPLGLLALIHVVRFRMVPGSVYPGVFRADMFYYLANAREIFENGNGIFYGDPFSGSFDSPRVYSHLELVILGWAWRISDLPLSTVWQVAQVVFGATMFFALYRVLTNYFSGRQLTYAFVLTALGGGGAALQALGMSLGGDARLGFLETFHSLTQTGFKGAAWLPNVFQNALFTTQSFYHTLAFATFAAMASGRLVWGTVGVFLAWWAHPFTGIEVGAIVGAFTILESLISRSAENVRAALTVLALNALFLLYYLVLIPAWSPEAADITSRWRGIPTLFHFREAFAMWGVFVAGPLFFLSTSTRPLRPLRDRSDRFLAVWISVVGALLVHELFLPSFVDPFQPLHFAHGYFFVPLAILTLRGLTVATRSWSLPKLRVGAGSLLALACVDNVAYSLSVVKANPPVLSEDVARLLDFLAEYEPPSFVFVDGSSEPLMHYLMVATPHKPYLYSKYQTPFFERKEHDVIQCINSPDSATACGELGIRLMVVTKKMARSFKRDIFAGRAQVALRSGRFEIIEFTGE